MRAAGSSAQPASRRERANGSLPRPRHLAAVSRLTALVLVAVLAGACASRVVPVVTDPQYPDYLFPAVPAQYEGSAAARAHQEAWAFLQTGDLATAEERYREALRAAAGFYPAEAGLGWVGLARRQPEAAATQFSRALDTSPTDVSALVGHGEAMLALDRPVDALASFEAALRSDPSLTRVEREVEEIRLTVVSRQLDRAREAAAAGQYAEATAAYRQIIELSPESGFLHVELGRVEQRQGNFTAALDHVTQALAFDDQDPEAYLLAGEVHEARGSLEQALAAYERADALDPTDATAARLDRVRGQILLAELPPEVGRIPGQAVVSRGDLAALLGVRLSATLAASAGPAVIITDTRDHWAAEWIQAVADAGVMDVDAGYRFSADAAVSRSELAEVVAETLDLIASQSGSPAPDGGGVPGFSDMRPTHLSYRAAMQAVSAGILDPLPDNSFRPSQTVSGAEAVEAADRLATLAAGS